MQDRTKDINTLAAAWKLLDAERMANELLRQQLAEKDAEIEQLYKSIDENWISHQQLAASQAREHLLIHTLENHNGNYKLTKAECKEINAVIRQSEKQDTSALEAITTEYQQRLTRALGLLDAESQIEAEVNLREMISKAGEVMRERCAKEAGLPVFAADAIRAIPGVTLEGLK